MTEKQNLSNEVNSKTLEQILRDSLIGKKIKIWRNEYKDYEYEENDVRPKFYYSHYFYGGQDESVCEIVDLRVTKNFYIKLIFNDSGQYASFINLRLDTCLQFVNVST